MADTTKPGVAGLTGLATVLMMSTFFEDCLRLVTHWRSQITYMSKMYSSVWPVVIASTSLLVQSSSSAAVLLGHEGIKLGALYALLAFVVVQPMLYGETTNPKLILRSLAVVGGLMLLVWHTKEQKAAKEQSLTPPKPSSGRMQLGARVMLTLMTFLEVFVSDSFGLLSLKASQVKSDLATFDTDSELVANRNYSVAMVEEMLGKEQHYSATALYQVHMVGIVSLVLLSAFICFGYATSICAQLLGLVLAVWNIFAHPFWESANPFSDLYRYYFFQTLSVVGGLLMLAVHGPGALALDIDVKNK
mmetsp:Transcript_26395/g.43879  ORF Transcript_26395/g.43879 Transcript_26395/m.43879 type:complete len:304 (+) Transcript_26395:18-929(+)|eukprot:CAMPEP_0119298588 /NCGR_PEP_ID=MMETSP1333-20130426/751_1 /TAXON_ID=418940 /ORGANISM="Scyphosphaera apsteinii, Strain RCC1455" /LENGTH=303 /DNA_ID=CAMNT_0007299735 /DNA_START=17 /DNA_END=928 /DNA_ORIENTATION=-